MTKKTPPSNPSPPTQAQPRTKRSPQASKVCATSGCPNLEPCATHARPAWEGSTRRQRLPADWEKRRRVTLDAYGRRCYICSNGDCNEVDHVDGTDDHTYANLRPICPPCHKRKTQGEATAGRARARASREEG